MFTLEAHLLGLAGFNNSFRLVATTESLAESLLIGSVVIAWGPFAVVL